MNLHCWIEVLQQEERGDDDEQEEESVVVKDGESCGLVIGDLVLLPKDPVAKIRC